MPEAPERQNLWELAVLALLRERPMHPYEMQRLLRERHKDELLVLKRGSLYHAINRLLKLALIEPVAVGRNGRRPERTTYRIAPAGRRALLQWIQEMISVPLHEGSEFMAAMSFLVHLTPREAIPRLEERAEWLEKNIADLETRLEALAARVKRINLIESEYLCAMRKAELAWIRSLAGELRSGRFHWDLKSVLRARAEKSLAAKAGRER
jgi:DNA-binding PadR family transcriptional regulator